MSVEPGHARIDPAWVHALAHPLRVRILTHMLEDERVSPVALAAALGVSLGVASYHVRRLQVLGFVVLVSRTQVRGSLQHHYELADAALTREALWRANVIGAPAAPTAGRRPTPRLTVAAARGSEQGESAAWAPLRQVTATLRQRREQQGISRTELAQRLAIAPGAVGRIERGEVDPRMSVLVRLAAELGTSLPELFAQPGIEP